jgi:PAS domain S-box-containing protein
MHDIDHTLSDGRTPPRDQARTVEGVDSDGRPQFLPGNPGDGFHGASGLLFEQAMAQTRMAVVLSDPNKPDMPIVFANRAFRSLTGYDESDVIGRNCRFLQGPGTDPRQVARIREGLANQDVVVVELLNYRKDGTPFWNALHMGPIYRTDGKLLYFFGSQWDVSEVITARADERHAREMARELSHRMKNMFAVISSIVNITGRMRGVPDAAREINDRVQALGRAYETTLDEASSGHIDLGPAIRAILSPYDVDNRIRFLGNGLRVPFAVVSGVGLTLHELSANSVKYGAWSSEQGFVEVNWQAQEDATGRWLVVSWMERDGPPVVTPENGQGTGHVIVDRLLRHGGGSIEREWQKDGLRVFVRYPMGQPDAPA